MMLTGSATLRYVQVPMLRLSNIIAQYPVCARRVVTTYKDNSVANKKVCMVGRAGAYSLDDENFKNSPASSQLGTPENAN
jgi:hypothetical protein